MKYFIVSDIHGNFNKLNTALTLSGFNEETDTLVSAGDAFDRGSQNVEVLEYIMGLKHKIILWGNHEYMLKRLITGEDHFSIREYWNGTYKTIDQFSETSEAYDMNIPLGILRDKLTDSAKLLDEYFKQSKHAIEFDDYYVCHGWLPFNDSCPMTLKKNWKKIKSERIWCDATWSDTPELIIDNALPDKPIIVGHYHADRLAFKAYNDNRKEHYKHINCRTDDTYVSEDGKVIAIDGCTASETGHVNVFIVEQTKLPKLY